MSRRQLATFKAEVCKAIDARWHKDNWPRSRGRPSKKDYIAAACMRIQKKLRRKKASLGEWYDAVSEALPSLSVPTIKKFTREWMRTHLPLSALPVGVGPYLINTQKDYSGVQWILIWAGLCQDFPEVMEWLELYKRQHNTLPGELPHTILPKVLRDTINSRSDFPLGPRLYDQLIRESLRNAPEK